MPTKVSMSSRRALGGHSEGICALGGYLKGTQALEHLRHSGTRALRALEQLGHSGTWALEALYLADSMVAGLQVTAS